MHDVKRALMSLRLNRRLVAALAISIALHVALFMLPGSGRVVQNSKVQSILRINLALPAQVSLSADAVTRLARHDAPSVETSAIGDTETGLVSVLPVEDRYFLYDEVDKRADFIYSAPIVNLEQIINSNAKVRVRVRVLINELGMVDSVTVLEAEPSNIYSGAFQNALLHSRFSPAEKDGRMVKSQKVLEIKLGTQR